MLAPKTLQEAIIFFADENRAFEFLKAFRWPDGVVCPACGCKKSSFISTRKTWKCSDCGKRFTIKMGTVFEESPLPLSKWLPALWMITNAKNGISSYEIHRALGVTQKTAWFMLHRLRLALQDDSIDLFDGHVEADETYIGAKARNMHKAVRERKIGAGATGFLGKTAVAGILERGGKVKTHVIETANKKTLEPMVRKHVKEGSNLYTDALLSYKDMGNWFEHQVVDHSVTYVEGQIHTNGLENFWSLLKRGLNGTYISVEPFHLFRYLDEQVFRYNERKTTDGERFTTALSGILGRRLTYMNLTGKELETA